MKFNLLTVLGLLGISLFTGIIIVSIGLGAAFPAMERVAAPFVCGARTLDLQLDHYSYKPGQSGYIITWTCVGRPGSGEDVTWKIILVAGLIYSALIFFISVVWLLTAGNQVQAMGKIFGRAAPPASMAFEREGTDSRSLRRKLQELKELRDSDLINEQEYEEKKARLLDEL